MKNNEKNKKKENIKCNLAKGKGYVDENCDYDFVGDPGQEWRPFSHTNNLLNGNQEICQETFEKKGCGNVEKPQRRG